MKQVMKLEIESIPSNEAFARVVVAAFATRLNPTMEEVADIKTAVSEAVTNAIIHGYGQEVHKILYVDNEGAYRMRKYIYDESGKLVDFESTQLR